jgi:hypothetical protein
MEDLITCKCGSNQFVLVEIAKISKFWQNEYTITYGFERKPNFAQSTLKLKCEKCGKYFGE